MVILIFVFEWLIHLPNTCFISLRIHNPICICYVRGGKYWWLWYLIYTKNTLEIMVIQYTAPLTSPEGYIWLYIANVIILTMLSKTD